MPFSRTETVIEDTERLSVSGDPVEAYLAQYALICLCADMQQAICSTVRKHFDVIESDGFRNFAIHSLGKGPQSLEKGQIAEFIGRFGSDVKRKFDLLLEGNSREISLYNDAVVARHKVAHVREISKSFSEIKNALDAAKLILNAAEKSLDSELKSKRPII
jgi:hypothetical protein